MKFLMTPICVLLSRALQRSGLDDETNAHLMESIARIDRALEASRYTGF